MKKEQRKGTGGKPREGSTAAKVLQSGRSRVRPPFIHEEEYEHLRVFSMVGGRAEGERGVECPSAPEQY